MLGEALQFLRETVNDHLRTGLGLRPPELEEGLVVFPGSDKVDAPDFKLERVTVLLVNIEEEHAARSADPHRRLLPDGTTQQVSPPISVNAYVLFVARFKEYDKSLQYLSHVLQLFQARRVFDHGSAPRLSDRIEKLTMELLTLPFSEQNHLWGILRAAYHPSLLYRLRMIVFSDQQGLAPPVVTQTMTRVRP
jgi:hypothetical protein